MLSLSGFASSLGNALVKQDLTRAFFCLTHEIILIEFIDILI